jgi:hypothetical protein
VTPFIRQIRPLTSLVSEEIGLANHSSSWEVLPFKAIEQVGGTDAAALSHRQNHSGQPGVARSDSATRM